LLNETGWEKVTEIVWFDGTFCAPVAGVDERMKKPRSAALAEPPVPE
jgi:hypothetical protein